jgi:hypothetical protein
MPLVYPRRDTSNPEPIFGLDENGNLIAVSVDENGNITPIVEDGNVFHVSVRDDNSMQILEDILLELKKLNMHMSLLTDVIITDQEIL